MADFCDVGSERTQQVIDDALEARRRAAARPLIDHAYCNDCDCAIPVKRRKFVPGVETCVDCQGIREAKAVIRG